MKVVMQAINKVTGEDFMVRGLKMDHTGAVTHVCVSVVASTTWRSVDKYHLMPITVQLTNEEE